MTEPLSRPVVSAAVEQIGWRLLLSALCTSVPVGSLAQGAEVAAAVVRACGDEADGRLTVDVRADRVDLQLADRRVTRVSQRDVELAHGITDVVRDLGLDTGGAVAADASRRAVQTLEIAIDALDIPAVRPFWKAVLAYTDEPGHHAPSDPIVDPVGSGPAIWFQQMDEPREQRNRLHVDVTVSHDEAEARVAAALAAGGRLVSDKRARAFWILADAEGNEACVCTWQDRDTA